MGLLTAISTAITVRIIRERTIVQTGPRLVGRSMSSIDLFSGYAVRANLVNGLTTISHVVTCEILPGCDSMMFNVIWRGAKAQHDDDARVNT